MPTWKRTSPHNILRKTWQNANCNHCHGNSDLFLSEKDLLDFEMEANRYTVVPESMIPRPVSKTRPIDIDVSRVKHDRVVDAAWLKSRLEDESVVVLDVREKAAYEAGHISFELKGQKLHGKFTLVKTHYDHDHNWLLLKHHDEITKEMPRSVYSGKRIEEL